MPESSRLTALFAKQPVPGQVKTRLCPPLSLEQAARLAEAMLRDAAARCARGDFRAALVFAPGAAAAWFRAQFPELPDQRAQEGSGLGERLASFVERVFARGEVRTLVVIGSDQPLVPLARLHEAHRRLEQGAGCVLGPDPGGGYYLIGLDRSAPELFTGVGMSSAGMCAATEQLARARGLRVERLEEDLDVDVAADLERLRAELADWPGREQDAEFPRHTWGALRELRG